MLCVVKGLESSQLKIIILICLLAGHTLAAHAEGVDASSAVPSSDAFVPATGNSASVLPDSKEAQKFLLDSSLIDPEPVLGVKLLGIEPVSKESASTEPVGTELWSGLKLERGLIHPETLKTGPAPKLYSAIALIYDQETQRPLYTKHANDRASIASITKLMTAMVILDAQQPLNEDISIGSSDIDTLKRTPSRLSVGTTFTRNEMLSLALMASENRAASALARSYPGGKTAIVEAMNVKARELGMERTRFLDPVGLSGGNVSTAQDLVKMVSAARKYSLIHQYTTTSSSSVSGLGGRVLRFINTNPLVRNIGWNIGISKTGFINEAGRCLVMEAKIKERSVIIVLLNSWGRRTRIGDANRIKRWMESAVTRSRASRRG